MAFMSMLLVAIGVTCVSKGVDAGDESHIRAFIHLGLAVPCIWAAIAILIFKVLGAPFYP
jgi:hypothetical protein